MEDPKIHISQNNTMIDTPIEIHASGLVPHEVITIMVKMKDNFNSNWESWAEFKADGKGKINLANAKPLRGTYSNPDAMGIFWSMIPVPNDEPSRRTPLKSLESKIHLIRNKEVLTVESVLRHLVSPNVSKLPIRENGLVGTLFYTPGKALPTIIVLGGSEGGLREGNAALLASYGFNTLSLAYFGVEDLPKELVNIPLDYIENAIAWLEGNSTINCKNIGILGTSKGGELGLLCASIFPSIKAVAAYSPSSVIYPGIGLNNVELSSWTYKGSEIPFASKKIPKEVEESMIHIDKLGKITSYRNWYLFLAEGETKAEIPIEKIKGAILLISGKDDMLWPSDILSDRAMERLERFSHPFFHQHISYPDAGHSFVAPGLPTTQSSEINFPSGEQMLLGGKADKIAKAQFNAWQEIKEFFYKHLQ